jgi:hypothetical protein
MMKESSDVNGPDDEPSDADDRSVDWLEHLASEPEAIWNSETSTSATAERQGTEETGQNERSAGLDVHDHVPGSATDENRTQIKGIVESTTDPEAALESAKARAARVHSLLRLFEEDSEGESAADQGAEELDHEATSDARPSIATAPVRPDNVHSTKEQPGRGPAGEHKTADESGEEVTLVTDDLMWLDDASEVSGMNMKAQEDNEYLSSNEVDETAAGFEPQGPDDPIVESSSEADMDQVPDDPDEAIAWLERLAAKQGAPAEELPTVPSSFPEGDDLLDTDDGLDFAEIDAGEIPEDPDEAMAWLEMLAAREGVGFDELPDEPKPTEVETVAEAVGETPETEEPAASSLAAELDEALEESLPSGLDEALGWLEELTTDTAATEDTTEFAEGLHVVEEPPTPAVEHDVAEALAGAELLFAEPTTVPGEQEAEVDADDIDYDDANDAMAWLEQLAARQGAPIEELTTMDVAAEEPAAEVEETEEASEVEAVAIAKTTQELQTPAAEPEVEEVSTEQPVIEIADEADLALVELTEHESEAGEPAELDAVVEEEVTGQVIGEQAETAQEEMEIIAESEAPAEDLAWLNTLGAVDAERWLEAEDADREQEIVQELQEAVVDEQRPREGDALARPVSPFSAVPMITGSEALVEARLALEGGDFEGSLARYSDLIEEGELLTFLIDDLEVISELRGPDPFLQQALGDAYARNGQLRKALENYRAALANL